MGKLTHEERAVLYPLTARTLVGRSRTCLICLSSSRVSSTHAELLWDGERWFVHDLGSRNGTFLSGQRLEPKERVPLSQGSELMFGSTRERFVLTDDSPPVLVALATDGRVVSAPHSMLSLPSEDEPEVTILPDAAGAWQVETPRGLEPITDQAIVRSSDVDWRIYLPGRAEYTRSREELPLDTKSIGLHFKVSRDEEHVAVTIEHEADTIVLPSRAHDFFLLTLARARLSDQTQGVGIGSSEHGWVYRQDVIARLKVDRRLINLWIYRARQQLSDVGLVDIANLIERRPQAEQLRLGVEKLCVSRI